MRCNFFFVCRVLLKETFILASIAKSIISDRLRRKINAWDVLWSEVLALKTVCVCVIDVLGVSIYCCLCILSLSQLLCVTVFQPAVEDCGARCGAAGCGWADGLLHLLSEPNRG